jgi:hypothetical protein
VSRRFGLEVASNEKLMLSMAMGIAEEDSEDGHRLEAPIF